MKIFKKVEMEIVDSGSKPVIVNQGTSRIK
jgi:hypothetical protein